MRTLPRPMAHVPVLFRCNFERRSKRLPADLGVECVASLPHAAVRAARDPSERAARRKPDARETLEALLRQQPQHKLAQQALEMLH